MRFLIIYISLIFVVCSWATAQEIYSWIDVTGKIHYSTKSIIPEQKPSELPSITKENLDQTIQSIRSQTPLTCSTHGGISCNLGQDVDGSVLCRDGFPDSNELFQTSCTVVRLKIGNIVFVDDQQNTINLTMFSKNKDLLNSFKAESIHISVRNTSGVEALGISTIIFPQWQKRISLTGPDKIEPYGVGEYQLILKQTDLPIQLADFKRSWVYVKCDNCR